MKQTFLGEKPWARAFVNLNMIFTTVLPKLSGYLLEIYKYIILT